ncbi:type ISP restriction/modification enzyme [Campylobacter cuniculorum]|uniref:site-specific DNA-methyltransferase (adenine-specific) n=1 Tax=Campylobacter cuniculorum TaxID=374106 RepID=A0ABX6TZ41_9BACT|nr:type ISP restriction/modification enzyme [Campylobacter cuniculorum]QOR05049.1 N-6 DNA methylase [Campylobacter cuniculorum]
MILQDYLKSIKNMKENDRELSHRPALENFLKALKNELSSKHKDFEKLNIKHEPNNKEKFGMPDFEVTRADLLVGLIENKRINTDLKSIVQSEQIAKYMQIKDNIILTDYLHFSLVRQNDKNQAKIIKECKICDFNALKSLANAKSGGHLEDKEKELLELFELFLSYKPKPITSALEFASALAGRTRNLRGSLERCEQEAHIKGLYNTFKRELYEKLEFSEFCDSFAQTLTYSLFLAKLNNNNNEKIRLSTAADFIPNNFPLVQTMSEFLRKLDKVDIKWLLEDMLYIINHIDTASIIKELNKTFEKDLSGIPTTALHKDPYLHFYETFLRYYDPQLRELRGVYYTPASVVNFIINAIDSVLKRDFELSGLSAALDNENITLLDFATGTGAFLLEAFRKALGDIEDKNSTRCEPKKLLTRFFGFEYLIAPYTIAHLKLHQSFKEEFEQPLEDEERVGIYLTNTLYFKDIKQEQNDKSNIHDSEHPELIEEAINAQKTKEKQILIITGNPPYSGASANKGLFEDNIRITYGLEPESQLNEEQQRLIKRYLNAKDSKEKPKDYLSLKTTFKKAFEKNKLKDEKNTKWLLDDYVKFICFAESKIKEQERGIFAFISNNSFLDNPTFRGMRYSLLKSFDAIYILDLHGNTRKKEATPDGNKDENVFDIMQGVSINIFIKNTSCNDSLASLYHYDLYGKRKDKYKFLYENSLDSIEWKELNPQDPFYLFIPQNDDLRAEYEKGWSVKDMFRVSGVGITSAHDNFVIDISKEKLLQKFESFKRSSPNANELYKTFGVKEKKGWDILQGWKNLQNQNDLSKFIKKIAYRPFDFRYIFYERKLVWRCVEDIMKHFLQGENQALIVSRQSSAVGDSEINTIAITDKMVDINFYRRGGEQVMPLYLKNTESPQNKSSKILKNTQEREKDAEKGGWVENFTPEFREFIDKKYNEHFEPLEILGYIYAVLFHKGYRERYLDFLKIDFPKVPFVDSKEKFLELSQLGLELIDVHLMRENRA